jgi:para-aminobenzoate synthetase component 1
MVTLRYRCGSAEVEGMDLSSSVDDPFQLLREMLGEQTQSVEDVPFVGGAIGYLGYDLAHCLERLPSIAVDDIGMPEMAVGIYDWAVVVDHQLQQSWLVGQGRDPATEQRWDELVELFSNLPEDKARHPFRLNGEIESNLTKQQYAAAFSRIKEYIHNGDCYQVNLAQRFSATATGDPWLAYRALRQINPAPFGSYLNLPDGQILGCSPERFLKVTGDEVETKPIKGTRPRSSDPTTDRQLAEELANSAKDRSENLMIVDLLRNDLGRSCEPGSIHVPEMFAVESFATVHHLVSTIKGRLAADKDAVALLQGCFPGGSITGTPKVRAMEIIEELEPNRRGIYCGSIGYLGFDGSMDSSITIRTMLHRKGEIYFSVGGGIVADSVMADEYQETLDKAAATFKMLQGSLEKQKDKTD